MMMMMPHCRRTDADVASLPLRPACTADAAAFPPRLQDGDMFKARVGFSPYFYIQVRPTIHPC